MAHRITVLKDLRKNNAIFTFRRNLPHTMDFDICRLLSHETCYRKMLDFVCST